MFSAVQLGASPDPKLPMSATIDKRLLFQRTELANRLWEASQRAFRELLASQPGAQTPAVAFNIDGGVVCGAEPEKISHPPNKKKRFEKESNSASLAMFSAVQPARSVPPQIPNCLCLRRLRR